ncbi:MAG TPA: alpha/beta hydrolase [Vicinamibacterales bacterium]|jgi:pimeloyl-ACP methyl ester carboxylesterase|nr:alpha/beta hydrolase [Vicinamibacterales bacterium]
MQIVDIGKGEPVVFIPGLHGRWEYTGRAVAELAKSCRVITFSLADEPSTGCVFDRGRAMASYVAQVGGALDQAGVRVAALCGVSFGGAIVLEFAAAHPDRVSAIILASTPGPHWHPDPEQAASIRYPRLTAVIFFARLPRRVRPELRRALPRFRDRLALGLATLRTLLRAPVSPVRMAARARAIDSSRLASIAGAIRVPALIIVGEASLDRVVPAGGTAEYARVIPGATLTLMDDTGHQGSITKPNAFAGIVSTYLKGAHHAAA